jgi:hypothetical protein
MDTSFFAQAAAITLVFFAGISLYQLTASHAELEEKAMRFADVATEGGQGALRLVRWVAYGVLPLLFIAVLLAAGMPMLALAAAALKVMLTSAISLHIEERVLQGEGYSPERHRLARLDSLANVGLAAALIYYLLALRGVLG